jgi:hypothetical protein
MPQAEARVSATLRLRLAESGIWTRRVEDRLAGFPDILAVLMRDPRRQVLIETKDPKRSKHYDPNRIWTPATAGMRTSQVSFVRSYPGEVILAIHTGESRWTLVLPPRDLLSSTPMPAAARSLIPEDAALWIKEHLEK